MECVARSDHAAANAQSKYIILLHDEDDIVRRRVLEIMQVGTTILEFLVGGQVSGFHLCGVLSGLVLMIFLIQGSPCMSVFIHTTRPGHRRGRNFAHLCGQAGKSARCR